MSKPMESTYWVARIKSGGFVYTKGLRITPVEKDITIDDEYVRKEIQRQQRTYMHREGRNAMPAGEVISIERRDPTRPRPAHVGRWQAGGVLLQTKKQI